MAHEDPPELDHLDEDPDSFGGWSRKARLGFLVLVVLLLCWMFFGPPRLSNAAIGAVVTAIGA